MATNWTDATLFVSGDVVLPKNLSGLTADADIYFHTRVKDTIGRHIRIKYHDYPSFDIEEITSASITELKETALKLNLAYICEDEIINGQETDTYMSLYDHYISIYHHRIRDDVELMAFSEPDGINDTKIGSIPIKR